MNRATPQMRNFAKRLMACETGENKSYDAKILLAFHVCVKLRLHLATFMGNTGFQTLLARSLVLAAVEISWLRGVRVKADGALEGVEELQTKRDPDELFEGGVVLLAHLLGLLVAFIGENLTLRLVREVWPKVPVHGLSFGRGSENENKGKNEKAT